MGDNRKRVAKLSGASMLPAKKRMSELQFFGRFKLLSVISPIHWAQMLVVTGWLPKLKAVRGFTLAEVLISLLIIAEIATFTIPKIITGQQNGAYNAKAKEAAGMVSVAFQKAKLDGLITTSSNIGTLTPYMNYLKTDNTTLLDDETGAAYQCGSGGKFCLALPNGAYLMHNSGGNFFGSTSTTSDVYFWVDPDGQRNSETYSQFFILTYSGRVVSAGDIKENYNGYAANCCSNAPWFGW
jgi:prepilin-type N-terminal cleavage/methylation domain-containing protein